jgi:hypothetical protein
VYACLWWWSLQVQTVLGFIGFILRRKHNACRAPCQGDNQIFFLSANDVRQNDTLILY